MKHLPYGVATVLKNFDASIWDGSGDTIPLLIGMKLFISYHECDGSLGLMKDGIEVCIGQAERVNFHEDWDVFDAALFVWSEEKV